MSRGSMIFTCAVSCALFLAVAVAASNATANASPPRMFPKAPSAATHWSNPYAGRADAVAAGRKLFRYNCAECHGAEASGSRSGPTLRSPRVQDGPPGPLFWFLTNGNLRHGMPSWSRLPDERRWQIVTYLKSLGPRQAPE